MIPVVAVSSTVMRTHHILLITLLWLVAPSLGLVFPGNSTVPSTVAPATSGSLAVDVEGDVVLGGLFPVHKKSTRPLEACGEIQNDRGVQRVEAMLYTLDEINQSNFIEGGLRLGARILDTCSRDTYALEQSLEYIRASMSGLEPGQFVCADGSEASSSQSPPAAVLGVIGGSYSSVSIQVANLLRLFKIPQVSYASTSADLSDKTRFEYFARTVPPDKLQARAMGDIVQYFNWTYVSTVASEGDYGEAGIDAFQKEARARNICIALGEKIPHSSTPETFETVLQSLKKKDTARVVVLFLRVEDARELLSAATRLGLHDSFVWVASDGWGTNANPVRDNELVARGALTMELDTSFMPELDLYFRHLTPANNTRNPWFKEYWESTHRCRFNTSEGVGVEFTSGDVRACTGRERLHPQQYKQESKLQFIYDAVYAMAYALNQYIHDNCTKYTDKRRCLRERRMDGADFYQTYILNVSFTDKYGGVVQFDRQGDAVGRYNLLNFRRNRTTQRYEYHRVGDWRGDLSMDPSEVIMWSGGTYDVPVSQCSKPCGLGEVKTVQGDSCCWLCLKCEDWQTVRDNDTCEDCPLGFWPMADRRQCYELPKVSLRWDSVFFLVPVCLACVGIIMTSIVMMTFLRYRDTPIVKASGRELSFLLLGGFLLCYGMTFLLLLRPTALVCALQRFGVGFSFSVTYSALLTKTNRISRIFDSASKTAKRPAFISPKSQVVIALIFISVQVAGSAVWFVLEPPGVRPYKINGRKDKVVDKCKIEDISFLISLTYNMLLIITCTVYAVKTRKIPENFNESKFIGFTMYTTCIIWLAFVPIYFGALNSFEIQTTTLCVSISLSASVALLCLFTPKMYIIVVQPEKNVRKLTVNSATYKKAGSSSISVGAVNHVDYMNPPSERLRVRPAQPGGGATETETDRDSMASLMFDETLNEERLKAYNSTS